MSRSYSTTSTMFVDRFTEKVIQPDASLVSQLHRMLDLIDNDNLALSIDFVVANLLRFHNPQFAPMGTMIINEKLEENTNE